MRTASSPSWGHALPAVGTTLYHYFDLVGLETVPFPNPLTPATPSTVIELEGRTHYAVTAADLPPVFHEVGQAWTEALERGGQLQRHAGRDPPAGHARSRRSGTADPAPGRETFYGFVAGSAAFRRRSFRHREIFGLVGFGTGGWDTDFPNSMLEILRVVYTDADSDHRTVVGGVEQLPRRLWRRAPDRMAHWPQGTSLATLHGGAPRPGVARIARTAGGRIAVTDRWGEARDYDAVVSTCQTWLLSARIDCEERLFAPSMWTAIERTHYMQASKTFVMVDRPFWKDIDPATGRDVMSMTLTDRMTRGTYLIDQGDEQAGVICLCYTWNDDALKWLTLPAEERVRRC